MRSPIAILTILLFASSAFSQINTECATIGTEQEKRYMRYLERMYDSINPQRIYEDNVVKVAMYRFRYDDGSGARSDAEFAEEINNLNSYYNSNDICFSLVRIENVDNSSYLEVDWSDSDVADSMKTVLNSNHPSFSDAVTIYVLPPSVWYRGSSYGIPSTALLMTSSTNSKWGTSHIAHEMGHVLGNFHTHDDTGGGKLEFVNRFATCNLIPLINDQGLWFDCCVGADGLCDTPADPKLDDTTSYGTWRVNTDSCTYSDTTWTDFFGDLFDPMVSNIMSYAPTQCRSEFTGQQWDRMHLTLDLNTEYNNKQAPNNKTLNGQTITEGHRHEMAKQTITVSNSSAYEVYTSGQVTHEAEQYVALYPGFAAAPSEDGFYVARAKDICDNSTTNQYAYTNTNPGTEDYNEGINLEDLILTGVDPSTDDFFGWSMALDGDYLVVGAPYSDHDGYVNNGMVYVYYHFNDSIWIIQDTLKASDGTSSDLFGSSVDIDGQYVIVGAPGANQAYVYWRGGSTWFERDIITGSSVTSSSDFGESVAINGAHAAVGAPDESTIVGTALGVVYVFEEDGIMWVEQQRIECPNPEPYSQFGYSLDMIGTRILIGQPYHNAGGYAYVFEEDGNTYGLEGTLIGSMATSIAQFGTSVALTDDEAYVGAPGHSYEGHAGAGVVYTYSRDGQIWSEETMLALNDLDNFRYAGRSISLYGNELAIGASSLAGGHNQAFLFRRDFLGNWTEMFVFAPSTVESSQYFTRSMALNSDHLFIADRDYSSDGIEGEGAVYMYVKD